MLSVAARVITGATYLVLGIDVVRDVRGRPQIAADILSAVRRVLPLPADDTLVVRPNGAVQAGAGPLLAAGIQPRLSALELAGSLVPTTLAGPASGRSRAPAQRKQQQQQAEFTKKLACSEDCLCSRHAGPSLR